MKASPAAAAGVARALEAAGLRRAVEISKGVETQGYYASPCEDHVRVEFIASPWADESQHPAIVAEGLAKCLAALTERYDVREATAMLAFPGEMREGPVLEVRSERWGR